MYMPLRKFKCPQCGNIIEDNQGLKIVRTHNCSCGFNGDMQAYIKGSAVGVQRDKDWADGKSDDEISEYLVPDENGNYKEPY